MEIYYGMGALFCIILVFAFFFSSKINAQQSQFSQSIEAFGSKIVEKLDENAQETPVLDSDIMGRMAQIERRQEILEKDCKGYLAKANTRMRRAEKLSGELEDDDDMGEVTQEQLNQVMPLVTGQGNQAPEASQSGWSLDQIRQYSRGRTE